MGFSFHIARVPFQLILGSRETIGRVVENQPLRRGVRVLVEYQADGRTVQFINWMGFKHRIFSPGNPVRVRYSPSDPTIAMLDSRTWIPFAGMFAVGAFLCLVAVKNRIFEID